ncbi:MAG: NAD-dependent malic enzyme, mitochondrial [Phylliscum demangeonii]|nr:MAG: NAD-dependent malic enzyme, mitochondrial [Phylliscum demangeonii]
MPPPSQYSHLPLSTSGPEDCALTGVSLLQSPYFNKGSAFSEDDRRTFNLEGLLPANVQTLEEQGRRAYQQYVSRQDALAKNTFMASMKEQNVVLYYRLLLDHLKEMFSVIYTPTEGEAIQNYSRLFRRPEGCFLSVLEREKVYDNLAQWGQADDVDYIVVTDGEEILGIGDQGNEELLSDDLYLGLHQPRVRGKDYDQLEDFGLRNARRILDKYRPDMACFNDDVQGTGCVTLAAIMSALHVSGLKLADMRVVIFGAGTAGTGIADQVRDAIATETSKTKEEAAGQIWCIDKPGILLQSDGDVLTAAQVSYARADSEWEGGRAPRDLLSVVKRVKPHVLIGTSTQPKAFTEPIVREMAKHVDRPIIFPLSNPTRLHEAEPKDLVEWTEGRALIATGSPFPPVEYEGKTMEIAECNNSVCFPGIGLGAVLSRARLLSDKMLVAAVKALTSQSPAFLHQGDASKGLLPDVEQVRDVSVHIAKAVIRQAVDEGLAQQPGIPVQHEPELDEWIRDQMWDARYRDLRLVERRTATRRAKGLLGSASVGRTGRA